MKKVIVTLLTGCLIVAFAIAGYSQKTTKFVEKEKEIPIKLTLILLPGGIELIEGNSNIDSNSKFLLFKWDPLLPEKNYTYTLKIYKRATDQTIKDTTNTAPCFIREGISSNAFIISLLEHPFGPGSNYAYTLNAVPNGKASGSKGGFAVGGFSQT